MDSTIFPDPKMEVYRNEFKYKEPFNVVCDAEFTCYVEVTLGKPLSSFLQSLLGGRVFFLTTECINQRVHDLSRSNPFSSYVNRERTMDCDHAGYTLPVWQLCMKNMVQNFPSRHIVVCTTHDIGFYTRDPARIVITKGGNHGIMIASDAKPPAPIEIKIMEEYKRMMGYNPPYCVLCQPAFVRYLRDLGKNLIHSLQALLGGQIRLLCTSCIHTEMQKASLNTDDFREMAICDHTPYVKKRRLSGSKCLRVSAPKFLRRPGRPGMVVCVMDDIDHHKLMDPHTIVVTPNPDCDHIMLATSATESLMIAVRNFLETTSATNIGSEASGSVEGQSGSDRKGKRAMSVEGESKSMQTVVDVVEAPPSAAISAEEAKLDTKKDSTSEDQDDFDDTCGEVVAKKEALNPELDGEASGVKRFKMKKRKRSHDSSDEVVAKKQKEVETKNKKSAKKWESSSDEDSSSSESEEELKKVLAKKAAVSAKKQVSREKMKRKRAVDGGTKMKKKKSKKKYLPIMKHHFWQGMMRNKKRKRSI